MSSTHKPANIVLLARRRGDRMAARLAALSAALGPEFAAEVRFVDEGAAAGAAATFDFSDGKAPAGIPDRFGVDLAVYHAGVYRSGPVAFGWVANAATKAADIQELLIPAMGEEFTLAVADEAWEPERLAHFYRAIDVLLVTSQAESQTASLAEAIACGALPLCAGQPASPLLVHAQNGLVSQRSPQALADMMRWCRENTAAVRKLGYRNAQLLPPTLSWQALAPAWKAALHAAAGSAAPAPSGLPRILILADVKGWIFERHANLLQARLRGFYDIHVGYRETPVDENQWDLVYPLEWNLVQQERIGDRRKWVTGIRSHVSWESHGAEALGAYLTRNYGMVHAVSERLRKLLAGGYPDMRVLSHGINIDHFTPVSTVSALPGELKVGWAGNSAVLLKGFKEFIEPLDTLPGVALKYYGYSNTMLNYASMKDFYEDIDVYVCFSLTEGNNNSLMEAAAMGRAIITTDVGTVPEYLEDGVSALIVPRTLAALTAAVERMRDDPALRARLGAAAREAVKIFSWEDKLREHRRFFDEALARSRGAAHDVQLEGTHG